MCRAQTGEQMNVIRHAAGVQEQAVMVSEDSAHVLEHPRGEVRYEVRLAVLGAEDKVVVQAGEGLGHDGAKAGAPRL